MRHLTVDQKESICQDISNKMSFRSIGHKYDISHSTVSRIYKNLCQYGKKSFLTTSGRKKKLEKNEILRMKRISNDNPFLSGREVRNEALLQEKISIPTANRYLRRLGLHGRIAKRVNYHSPKHISRRRQFCNNVKTWDFQRWRKVVFTDEVRMELESRRRIFVRRPIGARNKIRYCLKWKYNERRALMFWGLICADGRRELVCCDGSMNSVQYCAILQKRYLTRYMGKTLQQDNASCHCSAYTKKFIDSHKIDLLPNYPPCSPDLNIIENTWSILKDMVRRRGPRNLEDLKTIAEEEFNKIPDSVIENLYRSIPTRITTVLRAKGF